MVLFCDGASRGNPGPAAFGYVILEAGEIVAQDCQRLGNTTNNVAEYQGLVNGLKKCLSLGATELTIKSDSELLVRQLNGMYKVRAPQLLPLFLEAQALLGKLETHEILHVRREENTLADALCNKALDHL